MRTSGQLLTMKTQRAQLATGRHAVMQLISGFESGGDARSHSSGMLKWVKAGLASLGTVLAVLAWYTGFILYPNTLVYGGPLSVLGITSYMDAYLVHAIEPMLGSGLRWRRHFLPSVAILHLGTAMLVLWGLFQSDFLVFGGALFYVVGALGSLNQFFEQSSLWME